MKENSWKLSKSMKLKYVTRKEFTTMKIDFDEYRMIEFPNDNYPEILRDLLYFMAFHYLPEVPETLSKPKTNNYFKKVVHAVDLKVSKAKDNESNGSETKGTRRKSGEKSSKK